MATIGNISGSKFIGSPIFVPVTGGSTPEGATFHRIRLVVKVNNKPFEFSNPCETNETIPIDISSALRAIASAYEYSPTVLNPIPNVGYPTYNFSLEAYDDYMVDGVMQMGKNGATLSDSGYYIGKLTDRERLTNSRPTRWSRKPVSSREVVFMGKSAIIAGNGNTPSVTTRVAEAGADNTYNIYGIPHPKDGYEIRFINSLGVHENVFVSCLMTSEENIQTDNFVVTGENSIDSISHGITRKHNDQETWKMSSGPLDRQWQQWYMHEFLMAERVWIEIDSQWIGCHIKPDEKISGIDRQKASLLEVPFALTLDINGSPFA